MKTLVLYDSLYGNTMQIAKAIGSAFKNNVKVLSIKEVHPSELETYDLLIVGSPVQGGRPTPALEEFLKQIPNDSLLRVNVASFDTRFSATDHGVGIKILFSIIRYAAERIAKTLMKKGGTLIAKPEGFIVEEKEGPLQAGEIVRAITWAKEVARHA